MSANKVFFLKRHPPGGNAGPPIGWRGQYSMCPDSVAQGSSAWMRRNRAGCIPFSGVNLLFGIGCAARPFTGRQRPRLSRSD